MPWRIGERAAPAAPTLRRFLRTQNVDVRVSAAVAMIALGPAFARECLPAVMLMLRQLDDHTIYHSLLPVLADVGPAAKEAAPLLEEVAVDQERRQMWAAPELLLSALLAIDPTAAGRLLARAEADLRSADRFDRGVALAIDLTPHVAPEPAAALLIPLRERMREATPERAELIQTTLERLEEAVVNPTP
jgi:hypothetical protein